MSPSASPSARLASTSSLTPQRKHRKLLKDGSGSEVWPEYIEEIFVQGLREYWQSPMANYSQSRGRSRWRNQFLVEYLHKAGVERSKKQVASHIQVLRNMWKGEHEFALVAGGDELAENGLPYPSGIKQEDHDLLTMDDDNDSPSPHSSPSYPSPHVLTSDFTPSPEQRVYTLESSHSPIPHQQSYLPDMHSNRHSFPGSPTNSAEFAGAVLAPNHILRQSPLRDNLSNPSITPLSTTPLVRSLVTPTSLSSSSYGPFYPPKITSLSLQAVGMTQFTVRLDVITLNQGSSSNPLILGIRLTVPPSSDLRGPISLHGFLASLQLSNAWSTSSKCVTRVYTNQTCFNEEVGSLNPTSVELGVVNASLPDSPLSRCRWLDATVPTTITQDIIVDGQLLLSIYYDLNRVSETGAPSAQLLGHQGYRSDTGKFSAFNSSSYQRSAAYPPMQSCLRPGMTSVNL